MLALWGVEQWVFAVPVDHAQRDDRRHRESDRRSRQHRSAGQDGCRRGGAGAPVGSKFRQSGYSAGCGTAAIRASVLAMLKPIGTAAIATMMNRP